MKKKSNQKNCSINCTGNPSVVLQLLVVQKLTRWSANISQEADNFNVTRKLTVLNARTDTILLELTGTFALKKNNSSSELEVIIETAEGKYQKDYVYLNDYTMYVVEDISGSDVDKYHYEINFLPQWGLKVTHND